MLRQFFRLFPFHYARNPKPAPCRPTAGNLLTKDEPGRIAANGPVNVVLGKELSVLAKPEILKPACNLLHGSPPVTLSARSAHT
jgi:hypothetical protein